MVKKTVKTKSEVINEILPEVIQEVSPAEIVAKIKEKAPLIEEFEAFYTSKGRERLLGIFPSVEIAIKELDKIGATSRRIKKK